MEVVMYFYINFDFTKEKHPFHLTSKQKIWILFSLPSNEKINVKSGTFKTSAQQPLSGTLEFNTK